MESILEFERMQELPFVRVLGMNERYREELGELHKRLREACNKGISEYTVIGQLPGLEPCDQTDYYKKQTEEMSHRFHEAVEGVMAQFCACTRGVSESMKENFLIKLACWLDKTMYEAISEWNPSKAFRVIYYGNVKKQEYLFCYFLSLLGMGVMILMPEREAQLDAPLENLSQRLVLGSFAPFAPADLQEIFSDRKEGKKHNCVNMSQTEPVRISLSAVRRPDRSRTSPDRSSTRPDRSSTSRAELGYEELARLASSVVLIRVCDKDGTPLGSGSGIMVSEEGYILTNFHVVSNGSLYSIHIENDEKVYQTSELIKYNQVLDLALIRIERRLKPLPVYHGQKPLVRGQRVVAIGSPLGLFNSVSDGIISGFRSFEQVEMLQFTAPTSRGSSGGALLNMYGEVIGICTAGFDAGQNLNLAMGYQCICDFIRGFVKGLE